jgi:hypothetical protein
LLKFCEDAHKHADLNERLAKAKKGEVLENEFRMKNARGEWRWMHTWDLVFTRNAEGVPEHVLGTAADITDLKRAEEIRLALEREKEIGQLQRRFFSCPMNFGLRLARFCFPPNL